MMVLPNFSLSTDTASADPISSGDSSTNSSVQDVVALNTENRQKTFTISFALFFVRLKPFNFTPPLLTRVNFSLVFTII